YFELNECAACTSSCKKVGSVDAQFGLGPSRIDAGQAFLQIKAGVPDPALGTPQFLHCDFKRPEFIIVTNSAGWLRQIRAADRFVDVVTNSASSYSLLFYWATNMILKTNGLYLFTNSPFQTFTIQLVNGDANHVQINDSQSGVPADYYWLGNGW